MFFKKSPQLLTGTLDERFTFDYKVGETADGIGFQAYDKETKKHRVVWTTRIALPQPERRRFLKHVQGLIATRVAPVLLFGIDRDGIGFVVLGEPTTKRLNFDDCEGPKKAKRLVKAILCVEKIHASGKYCGNLTPDAFMLDSDENVHFSGFIGGLIGRRSGVENAGFQRYRSPEITQGELGTQSCDVYSLAVIGLELFGAGFPEGPLVVERLGEYLKGLRRDTPVWLQAVLPNVLTVTGEHRFKSASELLSMISIQLAHQESLMKTDGASEEDQATVHEEALFFSSLPRSSKTLTQLMLAFVRIPIVTATVLVGIAAAVGFHYGVFAPNENSLEPVERPTAAQSKDLRTRLAGIRALDTPEVFSMLEAEANAASQPGEKLLVWEVMIEYGRQHGMVRTAQRLHEAIASPDRRLESDVPMMMQLLNPSTEPDRVLTTLTRVEQIDPEYATVLAAAVSLDTSDFQALRDVIKRGARSGLQRLPSLKGETLSTMTLLLSSPSTRRMYYADLLQCAQEVPEAELWTVLELLVAQRSDDARSFARYVLERSIVKWPSRVFLEVLAANGSGPSAPGMALVRSSRVGPTQHDVAQFSDWYDPTSVDALLGVLITSTDATVLRLTFDGLHSKPVTDPVLVALLSRPAPEAGLSTIEYASFVGIVGLRKSAPPDAVRDGLLRMDGLPDRSALCRVIIEHGDSSLIRLLLETNGNSLNPDLLLGLLGHADKQLRLQVVPLVKNVSLMSAKQTLQSYYSKERDPAVRAVYEREVPGLLRSKE